MNVLHKILSYPLHPYLVCLYCLTKANADLHISTQYWFEMLGLLLVFWSITAVLQFIFKLIWSSNTNGSIILSMALFVIFFLWSIHKTINYILPVVDRVRYSFIIIVAGLFFIGLFLIIKRKRDYDKISHYLTILLLLFITLDISQWIYDSLIDSNEKLSKELSISNQKNNYNIYLIVPDGYASNDNLMKYWHFDNTPFISDLKNKGFFIAKAPRSNYRYTVKTISTMLNLNYFASSVIEPYMEESIHNNIAMHFLDAYKYKCTVTDFNESSYLYRPDRIKTNIRAYLYNQSSAYFLKIPIKQKEEISVDNIKILRNLFSKRDSLPVFHYLHSMITHTPYYNKETDISQDTAFSNLDGDQICRKWVDIHGNKYRTLGAKGDSIFLNTYLKKIKETNLILSETLNKAWNNIKDNSIVIVMSDHGFRCLNGQPEDYKPEAYQNFCAVYFPDQDYSTLTDTITPINVMRMTVNKAIGTNLSYLQDKTNLR